MRSLLTSAPDRSRARVSRRVVALVAPLLILAGCSGSTDGPVAADDSANVASLSARNDSLERAMAGVANGTRDVGRDTATVRTPTVRDAEFAQWPLPASLALTDRQKAQIRALRQAHADAIAADLAALQRINDEARAARAAGKSVAEVERILAQAKPIIERLANGERRLAAAIEDVFTPEQRRWLAQYHACLRNATPTEAQLRELAALHERFKAANAADLRAIDEALAKIAALRSDRSLSERARQERIAAILESVRPARERLAAAHAALEEAIAKVLPRRDCTNP